MRIIVAPLDQVEAQVLAHRPERVISLLAPGQAAPEVWDRPHLRLDLHDVVAAAPGLAAVDARQVATIIGFALAPPRPPVVLVHCWMAVSRSPAAALAIACAAAPDTPEDELAWRLRQVSPSCTPNPRLIALADAHLRREGRLIGAVEAIGRGEDCSSGAPFVLEV